jgi:hypothetical protein
LKNIKKRIFVYVVENSDLREIMVVIQKILYVVVGTILVVLGILGVYGVIGVFGEYASQPYLVIGQLVVPIALLIIGLYLLAQFYKKPDDKEKMK